MLSCMIRFLSCLVPILTQMPAPRAMRQTRRVLSVFVFCYTWWQPVMTRPSESGCRGCCRPISRCYTRHWSGSVVTSVGMFVSVQALAARLVLWEGSKTCFRGVYKSASHDSWQVRLKRDRCPDREPQRSFIVAVVQRRAGSIFLESLTSVYQWELTA
jgi:hypothetical protein